MVTTKFYLDLRAVYPGKEAPLKLALTKKGRTALIFLRIRILPTQWDREACKIIAHPDKLFLNNYIRARKQEIDDLLFRLERSGFLQYRSITEIRKRVLFELETLEEEKSVWNGFSDRFLRFASVKKESTKRIYMQTYKRMAAFDKGLIGSVRLRKSTRSGWRVSTCSCNRLRPRRTLVTSISGTYGRCLMMPSTMILQASTRFVDSRYARLLPRNARCR